jgi:hypothetical protein
MAKYTWSYSSLNLFLQCPHKYFRLRIKKDIVEPPADHLLYGTMVHEAAEHYMRDGTAIPEKFIFLQEQLRPLEQIEGDRYCEHKMGLKEDLTPCDFFDPEVWWRGVADLLIIRGDKAFLVDYKTSKNSKYADTKQLEILSLAVFKHFPDVKKIKAGLMFVVANDFVKTDFTNDKQHIYWMKWLEDTKRLEASIEKESWSPKPNFTCKGWCPVVDCHHNTRS